LAFIPEIDGRHLFIFCLFKINRGVFGSNNLFTLPLPRQKILRKGTEIVPFFISRKSMETPVQAIEKMLQDMLVNDPAYFLVEIKVKPTNNVKLFLDGDQGVTIEKCISWNRALYKKIEEENLYPDGNFSLEVSSPGVDEPLKMLRQYKKNVGRSVEVIMKDGIKIAGKLIDVSEEAITVEETKGKNKKKEVIQHQFQFDQIKSTTIQTVF
jgi:ribosome maturation factor RimP